MAARNGSGFWKKVKWIFLRAVMVVVLVLFGLEFVNLQHQEAKPVEGGGRAVQGAPFVTLDNLPEYTGRSFVVLYGNKPQFSEEFKAKENPYYSFTPLDALGRCGPRSIRAVPLWSCMGTNRSFPKNSRQRKTRIIRLRPWMHWGAAGRRTVNWGRSSSPRSPGGPSG